MAEQINVSGASQFKVATPAAGSLESLGWGMDACEITERIFTDEVYCDTRGGTSGPPIDVQALGTLHDIRLRLSKYDATVLAKIQAVIAGGTAGTFADSSVGLLYFQDSKAWRLLINNANNPRNYLQVIFTQAKEINLGSKHSIAVLTATAFSNSSGVIYNTTTT